MSPANDYSLQAQLEKWKPVKMPAHLDRFSPREQQLVRKLVEAGQYMEEIYWLQNDPEALRLMRSTKDPKLRRFLMINGARYDLIAENRPFGGAAPMPPGRNLYPPGLTREEIEKYVKAYPAQKDAIYSGYTVLRREGGRLKAIPYSIEYREPLSRAAAALREAAGLSDDPAFAKFLRLRADAFLSDDYYPSATWSGWT